MKVTSQEFKNGTSIPKRFTSEGVDVNPALDIADIPAEAKSLALIVDDPDAPRGTWVHWVMYNIPVTARIEEDSVPGEQGLNDFGEIGYGGPSPPSGTQHRYFFKLYALDTELALSGRVNKRAVEEALKGHIVDKAELLGVYKRGSRLF